MSDGLDTTGWDWLPDVDNGYDGPGLAAPLTFQTIAELAAEVDAAGPRRWLLRGIWPAGDYGVHAAEQKAQKTWATSDLAVSVASGTPWLRHVPVDTPGPVVMFVGEGGKANTLRRLRAIATERDTLADTLPIVICTRVPHLDDRAHLDAVAAQLAETRPALVTLDPLYLAARGADGASLYAMGQALETVQHLCAEVPASLFVVTHFNRKAGSGAARITGAGPAEWGRVLITATVKSRRTDPDTRATDVTTLLDIIGGEIPDQTLRVRRRIWADDPGDLGSPLHIETTACEAADEDEPTADLTPAQVKMLAALRAAGEPRTMTQLVDWVAERYGHGLRRETSSRALNDLAARKIADSLDLGPFQAKLWTLAATDAMGADDAAA